MRHGTWFSLSLGVALCGSLSVRSGDKPPEVAGRVSPACGPVGVPGKKALTARKVRLPGAWIGAGARPHRRAERPVLPGAAVIAAIQRGRA